MIDNLGEITMDNAEAKLAEIEAIEALIATYKATYCDGLCNITEESLSQSNIEWKDLEKIARKLALKWGVYTKLVPMYNDTDDIVREGSKAAKDVLNLNNEDLVCVIGGFPLDAHTNFLKIDTIK